MSDVRFDYDVQAWVMDGYYVRCGHAGDACRCYGRLHEGEAAPKASGRASAEEWRAARPAEYGPRPEVNR